VREAYGLTLAILSNEWRAVFEEAATKPVSDRMRYWVAAFAPSLNAVYALDTDPDDWRRVSVKAASLYSRGQPEPEPKIRVVIFKQRNESMELEMSPTSFIRLIALLSREFAGLGPVTLGQVDIQAYEGLRSSVEGLEKAIPRPEEHTQVSIKAKDH
jgi:hypothetical protein